MKKLILVSAIGIAVASTALAQGQPGWWDGWSSWGMMPPGYGGGPNWNGQGWNGQGWNGPVWGGPGRGQGMMQPGWGMGGGGVMMGAIDTDQDGSISAEEAAAHAELMFVGMDADQDGALVAEEFGGGRMGMMRALNPAMPEAMQQRHAAQFATKDGDSDGKITMAEFLAAEKAQYDAADGDGDGKVTPWELRSQMWQ